MEEQMEFGGRGHGNKLVSTLLLYHGGLRALVYITFLTPCSPEDNLGGKATLSAFGFQPSTLLDQEDP